jgi:hypothetical protein
VQGNIPAGLIGGDETMRRTLLTLACFFAVSSPVWADAKPLQPSYPFRVERSAEAGAQISGTKGEVIYREISRGRLAAFLAAPPPPSQWPVDLGVTDPLFPISFQEKNVTTVFYCPDKFTLAYKAPHRTVCFADRDNDGRFEQAVIGERDSGFVFEITGRWIETAMETIEGSRAVRISTPRPIVPTRYTISQIRPAPGEEGIVEVRYAGLRKSAPVFDISFRTSTSKTAVYTERRFANRKGSLMRATLANPLVAYWAQRIPPPRMGLAGPFPQLSNPVPKEAVQLTSMTIKITAASPTRMSAIIERAYPAWSWYRQSCEDDAPRVVHVDGGNLPLLVSYGDTGRCEKATWVQSGKWWIVSLETANSGPLATERPRRQ